MASLRLGSGDLDGPGGEVVELSDRLCEGAVVRRAIVVVVGCGPGAGGEGRCPEPCVRDGSGVVVEPLPLGRARRDEDGVLGLHRVVLAFERPGLVVVNQPALFDLGDADGGRACGVDAGSGGSGLARQGIGVRVPDRRAQSFELRPFDREDGRCLGEGTVG